MTAQASGERVTGDQRSAIAAHTPGPWKAFIRNGTISVFAGKKIGKNEVVHWSGFDASHFPMDVIANAFLIAAAPEMLAALKALRDPMNSNELAAALDQAQIAIDKAEGRRSPDTTSQSDGR